MRRTLAEMAEMKRLLLTLGANTGSQQTASTPPSAPQQQQQQQPGLDKRPVQRARQRDAAPLQTGDWVQDPQMITALSIRSVTTIEDLIERSITPYHRYKFDRNILEGFVSRVFLCL